jgi:hypothetical protein
VEKGGKGKWNQGRGDPGSIGRRWNVTRNNWKRGEMTSRNSTRHPVTGHARYADHDFCYHKLHDAVMRYIDRRRGSLRKKGEMGRKNITERKWESNRERKEIDKKKARKKEERLKSRVWSVTAVSHLLFYDTEIWLHITNEMRRTFWYHHDRACLAF